MIWINKHFKKVIQLNEMEQVRHIKDNSIPKVKISKRKDEKLGKQKLKSNAKLDNIYKL